MENKVVNIYCLINPIDNTVFYVGATMISVAKRYQQHISEATKSKATAPLSHSSVKNNCIKSIMYNGLLPEFKTLEIVPYEHGQEKEIWWYNEMIRQGNTLLQDPYKLNYSSRKNISDPNKKVSVYKFESNVFDTFYNEDCCYDRVLSLIKDNIKDLSVFDSVSFTATKIEMTKIEYYDIVFEPRRQRLIKTYFNNKPKNKKPSPM